MALTKGDLQAIGKMMDKRFAIAFSDKVLGKIIRRQINNALEDVVFPRFDSLEKRFDGLEKKVDRNAKKIDNMDRRVFRVGDRYAERLDEHEKRIGSLEAQRLIMRG